MAGAAQLSPDEAERRPPPQGRISLIKRYDTRHMWRVDNQLPKSCGGGNWRWARHNRERRKCKASFSQAVSVWGVTTSHWAPEQPAVPRHKVTVSQAPTGNVSHFYEETLHTPSSYGCVHTWMVNGCYLIIWIAKGNDKVSHPPLCGVTLRLSRKTARTILYGIWNGVWMLFLLFQYKYGNRESYNFSQRIFSHLFFYYLQQRINISCYQAPGCMVSFKY